eukprot:5591028-Amphidinium_carterae.5
MDGYVPMCPCRYAITGNSRPGPCVAWLVRPIWRPVARIGEAKNPGPLVCTCNSGGWSRAEGLLSMGHDLILMQETFLLQSKIPGASRMASDNGLFQLLCSRQGYRGKTRWRSCHLQAGCTAAENGRWCPLGSWAVGSLHPAL